MTLILQEGNFEYIDLWCSLKCFNVDSSYTFRVVWISTKLRKC